MFFLLLGVLQHDQNSEIPFSFTFVIKNGLCLYSHSSTWQQLQSTEVTYLCPLFMWSSVDLWLKLSECSVSERSGEKRTWVQMLMHVISLLGAKHKWAWNQLAHLPTSSISVGLYVEDIASKHAYFSCKMLGKLSGLFCLYVSNLWSLFSYIWAANKYK